MLSFIKKIFSDPTASWPRLVTDSVLGELRLSDDAEWWECSTTVGSNKIGFQIGGEGEPDAGLLAHAHDIVRSFPQFNKMVGEFLTSEARRMPGAADEIRQLAIEDVCLLSPDRPDDGMIYFKGPDKFRLWRCDYVARKPRGLGFDS